VLARKELVIDVDATLMKPLIAAITSNCHRQASGRHKTQGSFPCKQLSLSSQLALLHVEMWTFSA
jgi:hypothetical protein